MFHKRLAVLWLFITLAMLVIAGKLFYLQIVRGDYYRERAERNISYKDRIETRRGTITDRAGEPLAVDEFEYEVCVRLDRLAARTFDRPGWCEEMARLVGMDPAELARQVDALESHLEALAMKGPEWRRKQDLTYSRRQWQPVLTRLDDDDVKRIELGRDRLPQYVERAKAWPVFTVRDVAHRQYPHGALAAHVVGYLGLVNNEEYNTREYRYTFGGDPLKRFYPEDLIGRTGVEAVYEADLRGARGMVFGIKDVHGKPLSSLPATTIDPVPGDNVTLTIDARLQRIAEEALDRQLARLEATRRADDPPLAGAVVLLDPRNGDVLAAASAPRYDLNRFYYAYADLVKDPRQPLFHRATRGTYPMGSLFKTVVATAGLEEGVLSGHTEFTCTGSFADGNRVRRCTAAHGTVEMGRAIEMSCNVYFYNAGLAVGGARMKAWAERLGLGRRTGVDLAESKGRMPSATGRADTLNLSIGQGQVLATPLQAARVMGVIGLEGAMAEPRFARSKPVRLERVALHPDRLGVVRWGMHDVVAGARGTARANGQVAGLDYAGKTGTAQTARVDLYDAWFAGFAPFKEPRLAFACVIENTRGHGGTDATPIVREIFSRMTADPALAGYLGAKGTAP